MRRLALLLLLMSAPAYASPQLLFLAAASRGFFTATAINGISAISEAGPTDTKVGTGTLSAGTITILASVDSTGGTAAVYLEVDGAVQDSIIGSTGRNLTYTVTAGTHNVRVYGTATGTATFDAGPFSLPVL